MELDFVAWLKERLPRSPYLKVGVGDDAAVLDWQSSDLVVTTDVLIDGVHFLCDEHEPRRIGHKALAVNLSDLAAMGAEPVGAVLGLVLPRAGAGQHQVTDLAVELIEGMLPLAIDMDCPIVGGDTNLSNGPLTLAMTVFGKPTQAGLMHRDGAKAGDAIFVTGTLGGSIQGKHLDFTPKVREAIELANSGHVHSAMDLTDGLAIDLSRLCELSGVGAIVDREAIPISQAAKACSKESGKQSWEHALADGEDFELLFTIDPNKVKGLRLASGCECTQVGIITSEPGLKLRERNGDLSPLKRAGYEHQ